MISIAMNGSLPTGVRTRDVQRAVEEAFRVARRTSRGAMGVAFVSDQAIAKLNATYLKKRRPTDVLSFSSSSGRNRSEWGDIVIAPAYARREARRRGVPFPEEIIRLVAHGMLHLLGYDHATTSDEARMFRLQERAVESVTQFI